MSPPESSERMDWEKLGKEVLDDLQFTGLAFWDQLREDQIPIVRQAAQDLTKYTMLCVQDPENQAAYQRTIRHIRGTLESEAALASLRAGRRIRDAILRTVQKAAALALSVL